MIVRVYTGAKQAKPVPQRRTRRGIGFELMVITGDAVVSIVSIRRAS